MLTFCLHPAFYCYLHPALLLLGQFAQLNNDLPGLLPQQLTRYPTLPPPACGASLQPFLSSRHSCSASLNKKHPHPTQAIVGSFLAAAHRGVPHGFRVFVSCPSTWVPRPEPSSVFALFFPSRRCMFLPAVGRRCCVCVCVCVFFSGRVHDRSLPVSGQVTDLPLTISPG